MDLLLLQSSEAPDAEKAPCGSLRKAAGRLPSAPLISRLSLCAFFDTLAASVSEWHRTSILSVFPNIGKKRKKREKKKRTRKTKNTEKKGVKKAEGDKTPKTQHLSWVARQNECPRGVASAAAEGQLRQESGALVERRRVLSRIPVEQW